MLWSHIGILASLNELGGPVFDGVGLSGFKSRANSFSLAQLAALFLLCLLLFSLSLLSFCGLALWGWGLRTDRVSPSLALPAFFINNNNNDYIRLVSGGDW